MSDVTVTLNGKPRQLPDGLSLLDLLKQLDVQPSRVVVEHNREIRRRDDFEKTQVHAGDELELVYFVGGGASADDALVVGGRSLRSRLIHGTGKFASNEVLARCLEAAQPDMITVAIRRLNLEDGRSELEGIDLRRYTLLPNTAGAATAAGACRRFLGLHQSGGHRRRRPLAARSAGDPGGDPSAGQGRLHRDGLHQR